MIFPFPFSSTARTPGKDQTTLILIILNAGIFILLPAELKGLLAFHSDAPLWHKALASVTHQFLHADLGHIVGNMWFFWLFGPPVEAALGRRYLWFYLAGGIFSSAAMFFQTPTPYGSMGASGSIAAVIAAHCVMYRDSEIKCFSWLFYRVAVYSLPAALFGLAFFGWDYLMLAVTGGESMVAYAAHLGGATFGGVVGLLAQASPPQPEAAVAGPNPPAEEQNEAKATLLSRLGEDWRNPSGEEDRTGEVWATARVGHGARRPWASLAILLILAAAAAAVGYFRLLSSVWKP